ncbi:hypothetical protein GCM10022630_30970 [Thermobifida alba]
MPWVRLGDRFPANRKIRLLPHQAFRLYVSSLCYAAENLTDGHIPAEELRLVADVRAPRKFASELVARGLWTVSERGGRDIPRPPRTPPQRGTRPSPPCPQPRAKPRGSPRPPSTPRS